MLFYQVEIIPFLYKTIQKIVLSKTTKLSCLKVRGMKKVSFDPSSGVLAELCSAVLSVLNV